MKKRGFYIALILLYILFLSKDFLLCFFDNKNEIKETYYEVLNKNNSEEYKKLIELTNIEVNTYHLLYSKLLNRNIYEFYNKLTITKGSSNGIKKGNIVISEDGVIGLVSNVKRNSSEVILLTNSDINLSVKVNDAYGILSSKDNKVIIKNIKLDNEIKKGDSVYTSGLTNIIENLYIGKVKTIKKDDLGLEYIIEVEPASDFKKIKYVGVITS